MKKFNCLFIFSLVIMLSGCVTTAKYKMTDDVYVRQEPVNQKLVVDVFKDVRPEDEQMGRIEGKEKGFYITENKMYKPDLGRQISAMLSKHLKEGRILEDADVMDVDDDLQTKLDAMAALVDQGFDYALTGELSHYIGYQSGKTSTAVAAIGFGLIGALVEAAANPKSVGGYAAYDGLQLLNLHTGEIIFKEDMEYRFDKEEKMYDGHIAYAAQALRGLNNQVIQKIAGSLEEH